MTEAEFQRQVVQLAKMGGWLVMHTRPAINKSGKWSTPIQGHRGFPDLCMTHATRGTIFAELKAEKGRVSEEQKAWIDALKESGEEVHLWRPSQIDEIVERLLGNA